MNQIGKANTAAAANSTTDTAAASPMRKYWKPYFGTSSPSTSVELAGPPGSGLLRTA